MIKRIILTVGPAGCGKSTYARQEALANPGKVMVTNRDDIRCMLYGLGLHTNGLQTYKHCAENERPVTDAQFAIAKSFVASNYETLIVADTNLSAKTRERWSDFCKENDIVMSYKSTWLTTAKWSDKEVNITLQNLIERNQYRGPEAIPLAILKRQWKMYVEFMGSKNAQSVINKELPTCVIFDIDGTLAHKGNRNIYDFSKVDLDIIDEQVLTLLRMYKHIGHKIVICSGRSSGGTAIDKTFYDITEKWLIDNEIPFDDLFMRKGGDYRQDNVVKEQILLERIIPKYNPILAVDDRNQVVDMWRQHGIQCFQVAEGDF